MADIRSFFKSVGLKKDDETSCNSSVSSGYQSNTSICSSPPTSPPPFDDISSDSSSSSSFQSAVSAKKRRRIEGIIEKPEELDVDSDIIIQHLLENRSDVIRLGQLDSWLNDAKSMAVKDIIKKIPRPSWTNYTVKLPTYDQDVGLFTCCSIKEACVNMTHHWILVHSGLKLYKCNFCLTLSKFGLIRNLTAHLKSQHPSKATAEYLDEIRKECNNHPYVIELASYLQSIKEISDTFLPKAEKEKKVRGRIVDTEIPMLDSSTAAVLYALYLNTAHLRHSWVNGRSFPCLSTQFTADSNETKCEIFLAGSSEEEHYYVYVLPSIVLDSKTFQLTFGHGRKNVTKLGGQNFHPLGSSFDRSIKSTMNQCASNAQQYQKDGIRLLPEFASLFLFFKSGDIPKGLQDKTMGEDLKNICRNIARDRGLAFSLNYFSVGKATEETKNVIKNQMDLYIQWLTVAYDKLLIDEVPPVSN